MIKHLLSTAFACIIFGNTLPAQNCGALAIKNGSKLTFSIDTWNTPMMLDPVKFMTAKDAKKDEQVLAFNAGVTSGKTPPAGGNPLTYSVKKTPTAYGDEYMLSTNISGKTYSSFVVCDKDTLYIARNRGPIEMPDSKGGILGYSLQGVQKLPVNVKVGDVLPAFQDITVLFPTSTDITVKKKVFSHYSTNTTSEFGWATDSYTGETGFGEYTKTTTTAVYNTIDVAVRKTVSSTGHYINYMNARVTGEEELTIGSSKYKAYIIDSETWSKQKIDISFESADAEVAKQQKIEADKGLAKVDKMMVRKQYTNPQGYLVIYKKEWYVPNIGIVKIEAYDPYGAIANRTSVTNIE